VTQSKASATEVRISGLFLFALFFTLKVTGVLHWSWWWVTAPLWLPAAVGITIAVLITLVATVVHVVARR
jgi:hypothetical protein